MTVLLAGDFQHTLPVIPRETGADDIKVCLKRIILWHAAEIRNGCKFAAKFSNLLLKIGNGDISSKDNYPRRAIHILATTIPPIATKTQEI